MATETAVIAEGTVTAPQEAMSEKPVMLVGIDESEHSFYALEWTLNHFFTPHAPNFPFELVVVHAKPFPVTSFVLVGPGTGYAIPQVDTELKIRAKKIGEKANELCLSKSVHPAKVVICEGDARNILCEAVEEYHASILVIGSHGYGAIKRAVLGSVSDYCAHHAHCSVMIVKKPKHLPTS